MKIEINTEFIKLDSLLKLSNLVSSGGEAKVLIQDGHAKLNGEICTQRGRKIRPGDIIEFNSETIEVTAP
ncbi:S4 domain-containing protein YaaA [Clostridiaceae bacterium OttesenSCG-928-D20]|nr:S4 domain-containing protein YaaA [Clostridiaceae bacterium OttesenSCG-928-D20]